jgi:hypothetical protein
MKFIITEDEKKHILKLYEQSPITQPTKKTIGVCNGDNPISEPKIKLFLDKTSKKFRLEMFFNSTGSGDKDFQNGFTNLKNQIITESKLDPKTTEIKIISITHVMGSASNFLSGSLQPTRDNNGKEITNLDAGYKNLPGTNHPNFKKNLGYANSRWGSIYDYMKTNGKSLGFSIPSDMTTPTNNSSYITDTGGCTDEKRNITEYPKPGQYAVIVGEYSLIKKKSDEVVEKMRNCINSLKVVIGYFKQSVNIDGIDVKTNKDFHNCDAATFIIRCNNIPLATVNLNNGVYSSVGAKYNLAMIGAENSENKLCSVKYHGPNRIGATVYSELELSKEGIEAIIKASPSETLYFTMVGHEGALTRDNDRNPFKDKESRDPSINEFVHGDAPMVLVYNKLDNRILYHNQPFNSTGDVNWNKVVSLGKFDACTTITKK